MKIRLAGIVKESVVDGPGLRYVVFAQGCPHRCRNCHNPETWDLEGGELKDVEEIVRDIEKNPLLRGVTLSGGEPFLQAEAMAYLAEEVKKRNLNVVVYTGYTWEELQEMAREQEGVKKLLELADYVVDGPYVEELRDLNLPFRGSSNQRFIDVRATMAAGKVVEKEFEPWPSW